MIQNDVVRVQSAIRENIFNLDNVSDLKPYQLLYKLLHMKQKDKNMVSNEIFYKENPWIFKIRYQVEFYFGDYNFDHDEYLRSCLDDQGYLSLFKIMAFPRMRDLNVELADFKKALANSFIVEFDETFTMIRRKPKGLNENAELLGFNKYGI